MINYYRKINYNYAITSLFQSKRGKKDDENIQDEGALDGDVNAAPIKKKKKRSKGAIAANPEVFNGDFDINDCIGKFVYLHAIPVRSRRLSICILPKIQQKRN